LASSPVGVTVQMARPFVLPANVHVKVIAVPPGRTAGKDGVGPARAAAVAPIVAGAAVATPAASASPVFVTVRVTRIPVPVHTVVE
jgi:hypothetical protein